MYMRAVVHAKQRRETPRPSKFSFARHVTRPSVDPRASPAPPPSQAERARETMIGRDVTTRDRQNGRTDEIVMKKKKKLDRLFHTG